MATFFLRVIVCVIVIGTCITVGCANPQRHNVVIVKDGKQLAWLGVQLQDVTSRLKDRKDLSVAQGAYVDEVIDDSPAEKAGIKEGDVIIKFDGATIEDSDDLTNAVKKTPPKTEVKIELLRKSEKKTVTATLGRQRAPEAYSYRFEMPQMPRMPRMPKMPSLPRQNFSYHFYSDEDMYGLELQGLTKQLGEYFEVPGGKGLLVSGVESGSTAEKAGFKTGDVITKINSRSIRDMEDFHEELSDSKDSAASVEVIRKGKSVMFSIPVVKDDDEENDDESSIYRTMPSDGSGHNRSWWRDHETSLNEKMEMLHMKLLALRDYLRAKFEQFHDGLTTQLSNL